MSFAALKLLGGFEASAEGGAPLPLPAKARALLAYLALRPDTFQLRDKLAALLWGDRSDAQARDSLRHVTTQLRSVLNANAAAVLLTGPQSFAVDGSRVDVDVRTFERLAADGSPDSWQAAIALYRGDLLEGMVVNAPAFEEWLVAERERLRETAIELLGKLVAYHAESGGVDAAVQFGARLLTIDPLQEPVHRTLMRLYARQGRRAGALRQYQTCVDVLRRELGVEPEPETKRVYREILAAQDAGATAGMGRTRVATEGSRPPLIGRGEQLGQLVELYECAATRRGQVVIVTGEAGVGKSRLVSGLLDAIAARETQVLAGKAFESEHLLPYGVWTQVFRSGGLLSGRTPLDDFDPIWRTELGRLFPELDVTVDARPPAPEAHTHLFEAIVRLLGYAAARQPVLVVLEDLHWADPMSVRVLSFVCRRIDTLPICIVATARDEDLADTGELRTALREIERGDNATMIPLAPLSYDEIVTLVSAAGPRLRSLDDVAEPVWVISEGNPFVALETIQMLEEGDRTAIGGRTPVPERVRDLIRHRVDGLTPRGRHLVATAAVIGRDFDFRLLRQASELDEREAAEGLEELVRRRLVRLEGERFAFTHDRIRRAAYDELLPPRRAALHHAVARAIELFRGGEGAGASDDDERLGYHYAQTDDAERAITYLMRAAARAGRRYALDEAVASLDTALTLTRKLPTSARGRTLIDIVIEKADLLVYLGRFADICAMLTRHVDLVERETDARVHARFYFSMSLALSLMGRNAQAAANAELSLASARRVGDRSMQGRALAVLALVAFWTSHPESGIEWAREAVDRLAGAADDEWLAIACFYLAVNAIQAGDLDTATRANAMAVSVAERAANPRVQTFAAWSTGWAFTVAGAFDAGVAACKRAVDLAPDPLGTTNAHGFLGHARLASGDVDGARTALQLAVESSARIGFRPQEGCFGAWLAEALLAAGELERADELAHNAIEIGREVQFPFGVGIALRIAGRVALARGDADAAIRLMTEALETFEAIPARIEAARTREALAFR